MWACFAALWLAGVLGLIPCQIERFIGCTSKMKSLELKSPDLARWSAASLYGYDLSY
jgi:hypothetical protein